MVRSVHGPSHSGTASSSNGATGGHAHGVGSGSQQAQFSALMSAGSHGTQGVPIRRKPVPNQAPSPSSNAAPGGHGPATTIAGSQGAGQPAAKPSSRLDQSAEFGDKLDKALKPLTSPLSILSSLASIASVGIAGANYSNSVQNNAQSQPEANSPPTNQPV